jgi:hypothetical protein
MESIAINADTDRGVRTMAADIITETRNRPIDDQTIWVGHSMGGVAAREIGTATSPSKVGGVVTVGAPLNGARVANALISGQVNSYIEHGINQLLKGPLRQFLTGNYVIVRGLSRSFTGKNLQEVLLERIDDKGFLSTTPNNPSVRDLAVNSSYMNTATSRNFSKPNISIYGNENSPVHYRLASTALFDNDVLLPELLENAKGVYSTFYDVSFINIFSPVTAWRRAGWKAGRDYLKHGSETGWNSLIGAVRTEEKRSCYTTFTCSHSFYYPNCTNGNYTSACDNCWRQVCDDVVRVYNEPSDGLIHQSSQVGANTLAIDSEWRPDVTFEALGANHNEYDSHPGTRIVLTDIFARRRSQVDPIFKVDPR